MSHTRTSARVKALTLTNADTVYSFALPGNVKALALRTRANAAKVRFTDGRTADYFTIDTAIYRVEHLLTGEGGLVIYAESANAGTVLEILAWS